MTPFGLRSAESSTAEASFRDESEAVTLFRACWPEIRRCVQMEWQPAGVGTSETGPPIASAPDMPTGFWASRYVQYIRGLSVTDGYPDGKYRPEFAVTRG
jgi:hypothetical protein